MTAKLRLPHQNTQSAPPAPPTAGARFGALYGPATFGVASAAVVTPSLISHLQVRPGAAIWVLSAYALTLGVSAAVSGRLADAVGVSAVIRAGALLLMAGAVCCLLGNTLPAVVAGRVAVAAGSGAMVASALTLAASVAPTLRAGTVAGLGAVVAGCAASATLVGGLAVAAGLWRIGLVLPALSLAAVPACLALAPPAARRARIDLPGAGLLAVGAGGLLILAQAHAVGLPTAVVAAVAAIATVSVLLLARHTVVRPDGFVPRGLVTCPGFVRVCGIGAGVYSALFAAMAGVPPLLANQYGWSALQIGAGLLPGAVAGAVLARVAARRPAAGVPLVGGSTTVFTLLLPQAALIGGPIPALAAATAGLAAGATTQVVLTRWLATGLPEQFRGSGAGLLMFAQFLGGAVGAAAVAALTASVGSERALAATSALAGVAALLAAFTRTNATPLIGGNKSMELHRSRRADRKLAWIGFGYAAFALLVGACLGAVVGGPAWAVSIMIWASGVVALAAALVVTVGSVRPFRIVIGPDGLEARSDGQRFAGPWSLVRAISIERTPADRHLLVLWVADEVVMRHKPTFPATGTGPKGHVLVDLENVTEHREAIEEALRQHAEDRFRSLTSA